MPPPPDTAISQWRPVVSPTDPALLPCPQSTVALGLPASNLSGGCACCTVRGELEGALRQMKMGSSRPDYLVSQAC